MSEEANESQENQEGSGGRSPLVSVIVSVIVLALAAGGGFAVYQFVLAPRLAADGEDTEPAEMASDAIPVNPVNVQFDQRFVNVMRDNDEPAAMLVFQVTLECSDQITANIIDLHRPRFEDMLIKLHDSRTRDELDDVLALKSSIQRQAEQRANDLLDRLLHESAAEHRVTDVFHNLFMVQDQS